MLFGIPLFNDRVAPRCSIADGILIVEVKKRTIIGRKFIPQDLKNWNVLLNCLINNRIDVLVCGGISSEDKYSLKSKGIEVIDNVACCKDELLSAISNDELVSGYGFKNSGINNRNIDDALDGKISENFNCLRCDSKECRKGEQCPYIDYMDIHISNDADKKMLDSVWDVSLEDERNLCRLSELIYYAIEMKYKKIGIAYCIDLEEATEILVSVLRRFFVVNAVCCKIQGEIFLIDDGLDNIKISCNPNVQAEVLNRLETDFNIIVGLCIGADSIFTSKSIAPVTTLFVKDKSLANNPIGALYSEYYLKEVQTLKNIE